MRGLEPAGDIFGRDHAVHVKRLSYALEFLPPEVLNIERFRHETPRQFRDEYGVGSGKGLETGGNIRRLSHRVDRPRTTVANFTDDNRSRTNTHATGQGDGPCNLRDCGDNLQGGINRANRIILVCTGITEKCQHAIAQIAGDVAAIALDRRAAFLAICRNKFLEILRVQLFRKLA